MLTAALEDVVRRMLGPLLPVEPVETDSLKAAMGEWVRLKPRGELPFIDFSRIEHGVGEVQVRDQREG